MSRVAVVTSSPPFSEGGHLVLARSLVTALGAHGHEATLVVTPSHRFGRQASAYVATWLTNVGVTSEGHRIDRVISLRYPSYAVRHPAHVCWLNHRMREYYDLWDRFSASLGPAGRTKERIRRHFIHKTDRYLLRHNVQHVFAQSKAVQARLKRWGAIRSRVLYPPPPPRPYRCEDYGDFILVVSRLTPLKRVDLVVEALASRGGEGIRAIIVGEGAEAGSLRRLIAERNLEHRVSLAGSVDDSRLVDYLARCRAVCFTPYDEDFGFVTVEAFASRKPVLTCRDSGGPAELIRDGIEGLVTEPRPDALGNALRRIMDDRDLAARMGEAGSQALSSMTWEGAVNTLMAA